MTFESLATNLAFVFFFAATMSLSLEDEGEYQAKMAERRAAKAQDKAAESAPTPPPAGDDDIPF